MTATRRSALLLLLAALVACAQGDDVSAIPGPSLEGPDVVTYPLGPYAFEDDARKEIRQGFRSGDGCGQESSGTIGPGEAVQEIVIAEDPRTCRFLVVVGTPKD